MIHEVIASVLDMQKEEVSQILNPKNRLTVIGLINKEGFNQFSEDAEDIFEISPSSTVSPRDLLWKPQSMDDFPGARITRLGKTQNELDDFAYLPAVRETILPFLCALQKDTKTGVNILLYGPSGSGKTELSKVLAEEAGFEAYELSEENRDSNNKWKNWKIACTVLRNKPRAMITVDEADVPTKAKLSARWKLLRLRRFGPPTALSEWIRRSSDASNLFSKSVTRLRSK